MDQPLFKKALVLEYITIAWNVFEGLASIAVGIFTGSISLFAYGLESAVEVFASSVVIWELKGVKSPKRKKLALKMIGLAYLVVSGYVFIDASISLFERNHASQTILGVILMIITSLGMGTLGLLKRQVGNKLASVTVLADAKFTLIDSALSATVLIGLIFNLLFGWWWLDQALALFLAGAAFREGVKELI